MAEINFPSDPIDGQTYTDRNGTDWTYTDVGGWARAPINAIGNDPYVFGKHTTDSMNVGEDPVSMTGNRNSVFGANTGSLLSSGTDNVIMGSGTARNLNQSNHNTVLGANAGNGLIGVTSDDNVLIGYDAAGNYPSAIACTVVGSQARPEATGQRNSVVLGWNAVGRGNNTVVLGNDEIVRTYLKGTITVEDIPAGYILVMDADGRSIKGIPNEEAQIKSYRDGLIVALGNEVTDAIVGTSLVTTRALFEHTITDVRASCTTAPTGADAVLDIKMNGTSILSTKITIDAGETTSVTSAILPILSTTAVLDDAQFTYDIIQVGSTAPGKGYKVSMIRSQAAI